MTDFYLRLISSNNSHTPDFTDNFQYFINFYDLARALPNYFCLTAINFYFGEKL